MQKNVGSQLWAVFAFQDEGGTNPGEPVTGDAANITANLRLDGGAANAIDDVNPTEMEDGYYVFDITQAESNADHIVIAPVSATANVNVIGVPGALYTTMNGLHNMIAQTGDSFTRIGSTGSGLTSLAQASVLGTLTNAAADGDPTTTDNVMRYIKQIVNILVGSDGVTTFPAEAAPANNVSLAEIIRAIHTDVTGLNGAAMRGTDGANTTTPNTVTPLDAAGIRSALGMASANLDTQLAAIVADTGTTLDGKIDAIKAITDQMVFTKLNELNVNTKSINDAEVVGDGDGTPWDGI